MLFTIIGIGFSIPQHQQVVSSTTQVPTTTTYLTTQNNPYYVELSGGDGYSYGNVWAINKFGYFGPVCDDNFGSEEANVVCRYVQSLH